MIASRRDARHGCRGFLASLRDAILFFCVVPVVFAALDHRLISASLSGLNRNHGLNRRHGAESQPWGLNE